MGIINYVERQRSVNLYDYLVFVCGVDVSPYIKHLEVTHVDKHGIGSVDIVLSNAFDQFVLTMQNFGGFWRKGDRYSEEPKQKIFLRKRLLSKQVVFKRKRNFVDIEPITIEKAQIPIVEIDQDFLERYSFGPDSVIFSKFDTVKVYLKNPTDAEDADRWLPFFTGIVENKPFQTNYVNGESSIHLTCYDVRSSMSHMRVGVNPVQNIAYQTAGSENSAVSGSANPTTGRVTGGQTTVFTDQLGFFSDFYPTSETNIGKDSVYDNIFTHRAFVDCISLVITGKTGWVNGGPAKADGVGVGFFNPGQVVRYLPPPRPGEVGPPPPPEEIASSLEDWDNLCLFGSEPQDKSGTGRGKGRNRFLTRRECQTIGGDSFWTGNHSPFNAFLHFLIPSTQLTIQSSIMEEVHGFEKQALPPDWITRYDLLTQLCKFNDYQFTVTGDGDFVFEFPMYDFFPENFGSNKSFYTVNKHVEHDDINDEGGEVIAGLEVTTTSSKLGKAGADIAQQGVVTPGSHESLPRRVIYSNLLVSKYGARIDSMNYIGLLDPQALERFAMIEFQKRLADANKLTVNFSFRPWLRPNRPFFHETRHRVGVTTSVTYSMPVLEACTSSATLKCVRLPLLKGNKVVYQQISGGSGMPLSYNSLFEGPNDGQGIAIWKPAEAPKK